MTDGPDLYRRSGPSAFFLHTDESEWGIGGLYTYYNKEYLNINKRIWQTDIF